MSWYSQGFDGAEDAVRKAQERRKPKMRRFFLRPGESKSISFIDETAFSFHEHHYQMNDNWGNFETCIGRQNGCPFCLGDKDPYKVTIFTIIDHTVFHDKQGNPVSDVKRLFAAREDQALILKKCKDQWGGLKGKRVVVSRGTSRNSNSWGESFTLEVRGDQVVQTDWSKFQKDFLVPEDYIQMFAQKSREELTEIYNYAKASNSRQSFQNRGGAFGAGSPPIPQMPQNAYQAPAASANFQPASQYQNQAQQAPLPQNTPNNQAAAAGLPSNLEDIPFMRLSDWGV